MQLQLGRKSLQCMLPDSSIGGDTSTSVIMGHSMVGWLIGIRLVLDVNSLIHGTTL